MNKKQEIEKELDLLLDSKILMPKIYSFDKVKELVAEARRLGQIAGLEMAKELVNTNYIVHEIHEESGQTTIGEKLYWCKATKPPVNLIDQEIKLLKGE